MLKQLQSANTLQKFAVCLGFQPKSLAHILYKLPDTAKYTSFTIPKAAGGVRTISAPVKQLKILQTRLARLLQECNQEISKKNPRPTLSHGFEVGKSISTNAWEHKRRRYVLNLDIEDFFPTINFGRIYGYFMKNKDYALPAKAAALIAQIACFQGKLPQGSPCSPIIANLIAHILDVRLAQLAKANKCNYTRYADDLTFSTNQKQFPSALAAEVISPGGWALGNDLLNIITGAGFSVNHMKTRMQCRPSRQLVTGLTVNEKVNIRSVYYRKARVMCSAYFNHGHYFLESVPPTPATGPGAAPGAPSAPTAPMPQMKTSAATLEGVLSHIYYIKNKQLVQSNPDNENLKKQDNKIRYPAHRGLYKKFLYFRHFVVLDKPLILCEGKTDNIYLRSALKALDPLYPQLATVSGGNLSLKISLLKHSRAEHDILELSGGSSKIASFISHYNRAVFNYKYRPLKHPVIILIDNDSGASKGNVFTAAGKLINKKITFASSDNFYYLCHNLYLIKTPEIGSTGESCMEDFFDSSVHSVKIDGKSFNPKDDKDTATEYGKMVFADKVIRANYDKIDFTKFKAIFDRISAVIDDYDLNPPASAT